MNFGVNFFDMDIGNRNFGYLNTELKYNKNYDDKNEIYITTNLPKIKYFDSVTYSFANNMGFLSFVDIGICFKESCEINGYLKKYEINDGYSLKFDTNPKKKLVFKIKELQTQKGIQIFYQTTIYNKNYILVYSDKYKQLILCLPEYITDKVENPIYPSNIYFITNNESLYKTFKILNCEPFSTIILSKNLNFNSELLSDEKILNLINPLINIEKSTDNLSPQRKLINQGKMENEKFKNTINKPLNYINSVFG